LSGEDEVDMRRRLELEEIKRKAMEKAMV